MSIRFKFHTGCWKLFIIYNSNFSQCIGSSGLCIWINLTLDKKHQNICANFFISCRETGSPWPLVLENFLLFTIGFRNIRKHLASKTWERVRRYHCLQLNVLWCFLLQMLIEMWRLRVRSVQILFLVLFSSRPWKVMNGYVDADPGIFYEIWKVTVHILKI